MKSIILLGIKHCGKSTQGKIVAQKMNLKFYDTDDAIFEMTGKSPREIFSSMGKAEFLRAEEKACLFLAEKIGGESAVIATGGGICENRNALETLKKIGAFVFLDVAEETAWNRIQREIKFDPDGKIFNLPAYIAKKNPQTVNDAKKIFSEFFAERKKMYSALADFSVNVSEAEKEVNAQKIVSAMKNF
jgi:shikimate kinase